MKRTATTIIVLAIVGSVVLGFIIGRLSGGGNGTGLSGTVSARFPTLTATAIAEPTEPATPETHLIATPEIATPAPATPESASTPLTEATPGLDETPDLSVPTSPASATVTPTPRTTATSESQQSESRSLGAIQLAPTMTPTWVPNPPPLPVITPSADYPQDDGTSITLIFE